jgi:hypothetical protein
MVERPNQRFDNTFGRRRPLCGELLPALDETQVHE